jgi:hypothetical protein
MIHVVRAVRFVFSFTEVKFGQGSVKAAMAGPLTPHLRRHRRSQVAFHIFGQQQPFIL